ncbi:MAG: hypothetical protein VR64_00520 [Desulfatitalea sp. BRH_c12]|nr:MAG: hypothetical protein VR64_00520 [Desulfatitalea sp. BRH_c12]
MAKVRVTLIDGRIVDGKITTDGKPVLYIDGEPHSVMDAVLKGMSVWPVNDPVYDRWQKTFM